MMRLRSFYMMCCLLTFAVVLVGCQNQRSDPKRLLGTWHYIGDHPPGRGTASVLVDSMGAKMRQPCPVTLTMRADGTYTAEFSEKDIQQVRQQRQKPELTSTWEGKYRIRRGHLQFRPAWGPPRTFAIKQNVFVIHNYADIFASEYYRRIR